jgi:hypothetical protein
MTKRYRRLAFCLCGKKSGYGNGRFVRSSVGKWERGRRWQASFVASAPGHELRPVLPSTAPTPTYMQAVGARKKMCAPVSLISQKCGKTSGGHQHVTGFAPNLFNSCAACERPISGSLNEIVDVIGR